MKRLLNKTLLLGFTATVCLLTVLSSCKKDEPSLGEPPSQSDAQFTWETSELSDNIIVFTANNSSLQANWELGNGAVAEGTTVTGTYPYAGTYTVTLTVFNSGGSASSTQDIVIENDDPNLVDNPLFTLLTGGPDGEGFKRWVVDSVVTAHMGVGPNPSGAAGDYPEWWAAGPLEKSGSGMYNDMYVFHLQNFAFDCITNGDVYVNAEHAGVPPMTDTAASNVGDFTAQLPDQMGETWLLQEGDDTTITLSGDAMMIYWTGTQTYKIVSIEENRMVLRWEDSANEGLAWYGILVPEGEVSIPEPPAPEYSLPMDFETEEPEWTTFGNSEYQYIDNPDMSGINTSARVLETVHGSETWAGLFVNLDAPLDFSSQTSLKLKVWSPITGPFRLKIENQDDPDQFVELDVEVTTANVWEELTFDMTGTETNFDRLVIFPGWNVANAGTFYVDDIIQE